MLYALLAIAVALTFVMFTSRNMMLGFPCLIFWSIMGGHCYGQSIYTWDTYYFLFFASFGMAIFCAYAAFALREKRDTIADEEMEKGEGSYIDEGKEETGYTDEGGEGKPKVSEATKKVRERADNRRSGKSRRRRL